jgi:hypothetical protein
MSLSARQLVEIRRRTRAELLEAGVIDLKDIFSKEDIKLMESISFEARHIISKINGATLLSEIADSDSDSDSDSANAANNDDKKSKTKPSTSDKEKNEDFIEALFVKYTKQILLFAAKLLRKLVGGSAKIGSTAWTYAFEKTILILLKFLGISNESAKKAKDLFNKLVYHGMDILGHGKTLDFFISAIEDKKPEEFKEVGQKAVKMAKEKMKKDDPPATEPASSPDAETPPAAVPGGGAGTTSESLTRLNKEIMILERHFRNQKRIK